ncbi:hypothetical protein BH23ACT11_BH23ACT11_03830 [soil metagenome]
MIQPILAPRTASLLLCASTLLLLSACGGEQSAETSDDAAQGETSSSGQKYPDVRAAELESSGDNTWTLSVTISSPYDSPQRYADGWRVLSPNETVLGRHELMHDHASEQPFTRTQTGLEIPRSVREITVEARDLKNGYGGKTVTIRVPAD